MNSRPTSGERQRAHQNGHGRRGILLLVDDEPTLLVALERQFRAAGLWTLTAATLGEAWSVLDSHVVHCLVVDERLPDGSGSHFLYEVGRTFGNVGRVLLSAYLDANLAELGRRDGFRALDKECKFAEILSAVQTELAE
jgi:DNA-binding NtrC family response regulator